MTKEELALVNKTIDAVVNRLRLDAESMELSPKHCGRVERIVDNQRFIADWVDRDRGDIIFEAFNHDINSEDK